jgi:sec-independent protein translocase protein TatC
MPLTEHIRELRTRLFRASLGIAVGSVLGWLLHTRVLHLLSKTVCDVKTVHGIGGAYNPADACPNHLLSVTGATSALAIDLKVSLLVGLLVSCPVWLYQLWAFIAPGLHKNEKKYSLSFVGVAVPLFVAGAGLCYLIFPTIMKVLLGFTPEEAVNNMPLDTFVGFFMRMVLVFGVSFEVPLIVVALNFTGVLSAARLKKSWRFVTFGIFVFSAAAVPTGEPLGMTALAAPMCLLYYGAIGIAVMNDKRRAARDLNAHLSPDEASPIDLTPAQIEPPRPVEQTRRGYDDDYDDLT